MKKTEHLITVNDRGNIRIISLELDYSLTSWQISKETYQYGCKHTLQPTVYGKFAYNGRTMIEQAEYEFNKLIKSCCDKKYKRLSLLTKKKLQSLSEEELLKLYGPTKTYADDFPKPMLPMHYLKCSNSVFEKDQLCSPIIPGERCIVYFEDIHIKIRSKDGEDISCNYPVIVQNLALNEWFSNPNFNNKDYKLDCVLYDNVLYIYDFISEMPFAERAKILDVNRGFISGTNVVVIEHELLRGWYYINKKYEQYIKNGYSGLLMRNPLKPYSIGRRSSLYMVKIEK